MSNYRLINASSHQTGLPAKSVHMICTSPPFFGLRSYAGEQDVEWPEVQYSPMPGLPPITIAGCAVGCKHEWANIPPVKLGQVPQTKYADNKAISEAQSQSHGTICIHCGGMRCGLGTEPTVDAYIGHLMLVAKEMYRILRDDGTFWCNLSDSYSGSGCKNIDIPAKNLMLIPQRFVLACQADGWIVRSAMPWLKRNCLSGGTTVYVRSQKGDMPMMVKDLARLKQETIKLWNGTKWTQVLGIWEHDGDRRQITKQNQSAKHNRLNGDDFELGAIEIELRNGQRVGCTPEHRWPTQRGLLCANQLTIGDIIDGCTLPESNNAVNPVGLPDSDIGWMVGMYLAEGCTSNGSICFSGHTKETERFSRLQTIAAAYGGTCRMHTYGNKATINCHSKILEGIIDTYISGDSSLTKHLTSACWMRSNEFLKSLLDGYLEGDGHYDAINDRWRLGFCNNDNLASDLRVVGARLGALVRLKRCDMPSSDGKVFPGWRGEIRFTKAGRDGGNITSFKRKPAGEIVALRASRARKFWDIAVEDAPHTFALASGVLTHNSMPDSTTDRPGQVVESVFMLAKSERYFFDMCAVKVQAAQPMGDSQLTGQHKRGILQDLKSSKLGTNQGESLRNFRSSDLFFKTWQGLVSSDDGEPLAMVVNTKGYSEAHFACWPIDIPLTCIRAGTSEKGCCPKCLAPYERVTEKGELVSSGPNKLAIKTRSQNRHAFDSPLENRPVDGFGDLPKRESITIGWQPGCTCNAGEPIESTVCDFFSGSGTTGRAALQLNRNYIGVDISQTYNDDLAPVRMGNVQIELVSA